MIEDELISYVPSIKAEPDDLLFDESLSSSKIFKM